MKKYLPPIGFIVVVMMLIYLDSPYSLINKDYVQVTSIPNEVILADGEALEIDSEAASADSEIADEKDTEKTNAEEADEAFASYSLEMILEEKNLDGDYVIEEYREYEVYRDENGKMVKSVPTSNFDYLRYYQEK